MPAVTPIHGVLANAGGRTWLAPIVTPQILQDEIETIGSTGALKIEALGEILPGKSESDVRSMLEGEYIFEGAFLVSQQPDGAWIAEGQAEVYPVRKIQSSLSVHEADILHDLALLETTACEI